MQELQGYQTHGEVIVKEAIKNNVKIIPIPGAVALINALIASGLDTKEFYFIGFLSASKKEKKEKLEEIKNIKNTIIFYEAPHKLIKTLEIIMEIFGNRKMVLAKEISKIHEEFIRGTVQEVLDKCSEPKGEYVLLVEGNSEIKELDYSKMSLEEHYKIYEKQGLEKKEIIKKIAKDRNVNKNEIYKKFIV